MMQSSPWSTAVTSPPSPLSIPNLLRLLLLPLLATTSVQAFGVLPPSLPSSHLPLTKLSAAETVEVCGFKDCRRAGGGARLEKLVNTVLEEKGLLDSVKVEICDCQGECGYGPNVVVDGKLINGVKGRDAVINALGIANDDDVESTE